MIPMHRSPRHHRLLPGLCAVAIAGLPACGNDTGVSPFGSASSGVVALGSDYSASSVSFLDRDGNLLLDGCLNSGSGGPGLAMTLSGDVVLPTQMPAGGPVAIIDRTNVAITWLDAATCAVRGQLAVGTGFASNPHDVVTLSASKAYVTREAGNRKPTPAPGDFDDGNDVLIVDPAGLAIVGRIDLLPYAPAGVLPRADRALLAQGKVFVSLGAISADYGTYGQGRILVIDPDRDQVTGTIELPGVQNCGAMTYVAGAQRLLVACNGAYGDPAAQAAGSAIVAVDLAQVPPVVVAQVAATTAGGAPLSSLTLAASDGATALGVAVGDFTGNPPDSLWSLPLGGGTPAKVFDSTEGFVIGAVLYDPDRHRVLAADGTMNTAAYLRIFDHAAGSFTAVKTVITNPAHNLPPRSLAFY
jgi:hypothetical protein